MSKIVFLHRQISFAQAAHTDQDVLDWFNQAFKAIGPYFKGKITGTGLTPTEQKLLMPWLHGVEASDRDFRKTTERFFDEILTKIPPQGLKLEIGLEDDSITLSEDNLPLNIKDFITYRHAVGHPSVAMSKDDADRNPIKHFYLQDPDAITVTDIELNKLEDEAISAYFKYKDDELKVDMILTVMGNVIRGLTTSDKVLKFKGLAKKSASNKGETEQRQELQRFVDVCSDQDLELKYLIQELIGAQILEKMGTAIHIKETGQLLGNNVKETVAFLKNPKNSRTYNMLRGQYGAIVKKDAIIPGLDPAEVPDNVDVPEETGRKAGKPLKD